eukprot:Em0011g1034a
MMIMIMIGHRNQGNCRSFILSNVFSAHVTGVKVLAINTTSVRVSWLAVQLPPDGILTGYTVYYLSLPNTSKRQSGGYTNHTFPPTTTDGDINYLNPNGVYQFSVVAQVTIMELSSLLVVRWRDGHITGQHTHHHSRSLFKEMAEYDSIKEFLRSGCYPSDCSKDQKRAFRRRASNYKLERGVLYYSKVVGRSPSLPERNWRRVISYNEYLGTRPDNGKLSCCSTR